MAALKQSELIDWRETYEEEDKIPFGTFLVYEQLPQLFPDQEIRKSERPFSEWLKKETRGTNLIMVGKKLELGETDLDLLMDYVHRGNELFLAHEEIPQEFFEVLGLESSIEMEWYKDTANAFCLVNPAYQNDTFVYVGLDNNYYIASDYSSFFHTLAIDESSKEPIFVKIPHGLGHVYLHVVPRAFTNIYLAKNPDFVSRCLSYLPVQETIWDEYYKPFRYKEKSQFSYIHQNKALNYAWQILLYGSLLALFFFAKRKQRAIPHQPTPPNRSLEFIETIGDLYFNEGNHKDVAQKKIRYFYHHVQMKYLLHENDVDFWLHLQKKTGVKEDVLKKLKDMILATSSFTRISPEYLLRLNTHLEEFYAQSGKYHGNE
ncbi:MAG: hypothetical protein LPK49_06335 [Bacteroidota bacterium]|nr:hypothetical protein [Bacteroidota bacterium]